MIKNKRKIWMISMLFNVVLAIVCIKTCPVRFWTDDDWGIANYMSGIRGSEYATPYIKFINICLSTVLYALYQLYHDINWFAVAELGIIWLSFTILTYILGCKLRNRFDKCISYLVPVLFVSSFCGTFYVRMQFTQTAAVGCIAGATLLMYSFKKSGERINAEKIIGVVLVCVSFLFRSNCFLLILPFTFFMVLDFFFTEDGTIIKHFDIVAIIKEHIWCIVIWIVIFLLWITALFIQDFSYGEKYDSYNEFNSARSSVIDYKRYPYEEIKDELDKIGVSANDYTLITSWTFEEPEFITTDLLKQIKALQPEMDLKENIVGFFQNYAEKMLTKEYIFVILVLAIFSLLDYKRMKFAFWYALVMINIISFYFTAIGRYPSYVKISVLFAAICLALYQVEFANLSGIKNRQIIVTSVTLMLALLPLGNDYYLSNVGKFKFDSAGIEMYDYLNSREGDYFFVPTFSSGGMPSLRNSYSVFRSTKSGTYRNVIGLGGWSTGNPDQVAAYNSWGIYSPLRQIADENVYLVTDANAVKLLQTYLYEHTGKETTYALTNVMYGTTIYKVTTELEIDSEKQIELSNMSVELDGTYNAYSIWTDIIGEKELEGKEFDAYYSIYDKETGITQYYMLYNAEHMMLNSIDIRRVNAVIPIEYILPGKEYIVNIVLIDENGTTYGSSCEGLTLYVE